MPIPETEEEVLRWLPEIDAVSGKLRDDVLELFMNDVPDYLWVVRASENHHPVDHRKQHGLIIHIKRSFSAWLRIERMFKELSLIDSFEANCGRAAILAHDAFKYGKSSWKGEDALYHQYVDDEYRDLVIGLPRYTDREHGSVCADFIEDNYNVPNTLTECVRTHNGGFSDDPNPETPLEIGHHLADAIASDIMCQCRMYDPDGVFTDYVEARPPIVSPAEEGDVEKLMEL